MRRLRNSFSLFNLQFSVQFLKRSLRNLGRPKNGNQPDLDGIPISVAFQIISWLSAFLMSVKVTTVFELEVRFDAMTLHFNQNKNAA